MPISTVIGQLEGLRIKHLTQVAKASATELQKHVLQVQTNAKRAQQKADQVAARQALSMDAQKIKGQAVVAAAEGKGGKSDPLLPQLFSEKGQWSEVGKMIGDLVVDTNVNEPQLITASPSVELFLADRVAAKTI